MPCRRDCRSPRPFRARVKAWRPTRNSLVGALVSYERERADAAIEAALALRSVERSVEEVLLPTLDEIARRYGIESAAWAFAAHWGARLAAPRAAARATAGPPACRSCVGDASRDELDPDAPYIRALELFCVRAGVKRPQPVGPRRGGDRRRGGDPPTEPRRRWPVVTWVTTRSRDGPTRSGSRPARCRSPSTVAAASAVAMRTTGTGVLPSARRRGRSGGSSSCRG